MAEVLSEPEAREKQRSRESLTSDTVKYESGPDGGEEVSMSVEWNGVSTVQSPPLALPPAAELTGRFHPDGAGTPHQSWAGCGQGNRGGAGNVFLRWSFRQLCCLFLQL